MSEHTPGPWDAKHWRVCANWEFGDPEPCKVICDTANNKETRNDINAANARLIAAAPELLEACEAWLLHADPNILYTVHINGEMVNLTKYTKAAVSKVRGEK